MADPQESEAAEPRPEETPPNPAPAVDLKPSLDNSVRNATVILAYLSEHENKPLNSKDIEPIISLSRALQTNQPITPEMEVNFWETYSRLTSAISPFKVSEIVTFYEFKEQHYSLRSYISSIVLIPAATVLFVISQFYVTDGTLLAQQLDSYLQCYVAPEAPIKVEAVSETGAVVAPAATGDSATQKAAKLDDIAANCAALAIINASPYPVSATYKPRLPKNFMIDELGYSLYEWRRLYFVDVKPKDVYFDKRLVETDSVTLALYQLEKAKNQIKIINSWILPFLIGSLGAVTQMMRSINVRLAQKRGINKTDRLQYAYSILLGSVGAIVAGVFSASDTLPSNLADLPPLILAFLVGYNANLVFTILDRMLENLKTAFVKTPS